MLRCYRIFVTTATVASNRSASISSAETTPPEDPSQLERELRVPCRHAPAIRLQRDARGVVVLAKVGAGVARGRDPLGQLPGFRDLARDEVSPLPRQAVVEGAPLVAEAALARGQGRAFVFDGARGAGVDADEIGAVGVGADDDEDEGLLPFRLCSNYVSGSHMMAARVLSRGSAVPSAYCCRISKYVSTKK
ncbi:hypothetical protein PG999_007842 [Apiospora kogelbergensis]|uniref:Uncharacterized protein n=1 Tax=Apiospora kogelbergensis TaxID=1337665 RepID=A0AAW0QVM9_9PEZI